MLIRTRLVSFALEPRLVVADASARVEVADSGNSRREPEVKAVRSGSTTPRGEERREIVLQEISTPAITPKAVRRVPVNVQWAYISHLRLPPAGELPVTFFFGL